MSRLAKRTNQLKRLAPPWLARPHGLLPIPAIVAFNLILVMVLADSYRLGLLLAATTFAIATVGLDLLVGWGGVIVLSTPAFMLVGALSSGYATTKTGWDPSVASLLGVVIGTVAGLIIAMIVGVTMLRVGRIGFAIVSLFFLLALSGAIEQIQMFGGSTGLPGVPNFHLWGMNAGRNVAGAVLGIAVLAAVVFLAHVYTTSGAGRELEATRDDDVAARALGIAVGRRRIEAFVIGSIFAVWAGNLYAHTTNYVSVEALGVGALLHLLLIEFVGGIRRVWAAAIAAPIIYLTLDAVGDVAGRAELLVKGLLFTLALVSLRGGLAGALVRVYQWFVDRLVRRFNFERIGSVSEKVASTSTTDLRQPSWSTLLPLSEDVDAKSDQPLLHLDGVTKTFGGLAAVNEVTIDVLGGECVGLIGPNGAGKSTLFNLISGLLPVSAGTIYLDTQDITKRSDVATARLGVSRTFQMVRVFRDLSVLDNVVVGVRHANTWGMYAAATRSEHEARLRAEWALELVGITHLAAESVQHLPIGQQRLVELARAVASRPRLLLLDEPASGLSSVERTELAKVIKVLSSKITIIVVEHDVPFVASVCDRLIVMASGVRIYDGDVDLGLRDSTVIDAYLGEQGLAHEVVG